MGSRATRAPFFLASSDVVSVDPSSITIGTTRRPSISSGSSCSVAPTFSASLNAGDTTTIRRPSGSSWAASQSNACTASDSTSSRMLRTLWSV